MQAATAQDRGLGTLVTFNPIAVRGDETLDDLAERLRSSGFHHWPVVDADRRLLGIVSDSDVVRHFSARQAALEVLASREPAAMNEVYAEDIMSPRVVRIDLEATQTEALERMLTSDVHSLPVVEGQRLAGIVTSTDFLREYSEGNLPGHQEPISRRMSKTLDFVEADATLDQARMELMTCGLANLPVKMGECPIGVVSQRMLRARKCLQLLEESLESRPSGSDIRIAELVKSAPTVKPGERLARAASLMVEYSVQAIAVVSQGSKLFGVISEDEILQAILKGMQQADT